MGKATVEQPRQEEQAMPGAPEPVPAPAYSDTVARAPPQVKQEAKPQAIPSFQAPRHFARATYIPESASEKLFIYPLAQKADVTSYLGPRTITLRDGRRISDKHTGDDLGVANGTYVYASADGVIVKAGWVEPTDTAKSYGLYIEIDHGNGLKTIYGHLSKIAAYKIGGTWQTLKPGEAVKTGDIIGASGSTGNSTGPHLHWEARHNGVAVDPFRLLEVSQNANALAVFANYWLGRPYVWGGETVDGVDCSGLVYNWLAATGNNVGRASAEGYYQNLNGYNIEDYGQLQPGDIVFFDRANEGIVEHTGIYIGKGRFIHAANPDKGVIISSFDDAYYSRRFVGARRINRTANVLMASSLRGFGMGGEGAAPRQNADGVSIRERAPAARPAEQPFRLDRFSTQDAEDARARLSDLADIIWVKGGRYNQINCVFLHGLFYRNKLADYGRAFDMALVNFERAYERDKEFLTPSQQLAILGLDRQPGKGVGLAGGVIERVIRIIEKTAPDYRLPADNQSMQDHLDKLRRYRQEAEEESRRLMDNRAQVVTNEIRPAEQVAPKNPPAAVPQLQVNAARNTNPQITGKKGAAVPRPVRPAGVKQGGAQVPEETSARRQAREEAETKRAKAQSFADENRAGEEAKRQQKAKEEDAKRQANREAKEQLEAELAQAQRELEDARMHVETIGVADLRARVRDYYAGERKVLAARIALQETKLQQDGKLSDADLKELARSRAGLVALLRFGEFAVKVKPDELAGAEAKLEDLVANNSQLNDEKPVVNAQEVAALNAKLQKLEGQLAGLKSYELSRSAVQAEIDLIKVQVQLPQVTGVDIYVLNESARILSAKLDLVKRSVGFLPEISRRVPAIKIAVGEDGKPITKDVPLEILVAIVRVQRLLDPTFDVSNVEALRDLAQRVANNPKEFSDKIERAQEFNAKEKEYFRVVIENANFVLNHLTTTEEDEKAKQQARDEDRAGERLGQTERMLGVARSKPRLGAAIGQNQDGNFFAGIKYDIGGGADRAYVRAVGVFNCIATVDARLLEERSMRLGFWNIEFNLRVARAQLAVLKAETDEDAESNRIEIQVSAIESAMARLLSAQKELENKWLQVTHKNWDSKTLPEITPEDIGSPEKAFEKVRIWLVREFYIERTIEILERLSLKIDEYGPIVRSTIGGLEAVNFKGVGDKVYKAVADKASKSKLDRPARRPLQESLEVFRRVLQGDFKDRSRNYSINPAIGFENNRFGVWGFLDAGLFKGKEDGRLLLNITPGANIQESLRQLDEDERLIKENIARYQGRGNLLGVEISATEELLDNLRELTLVQIMRDELEDMQARAVASPKVKKAPQTVPQVAAAGNDNPTVPQNTAELKTRLEVAAQANTQPIVEAYGRTKKEAQRLSGKDISARANAGLGMDSLLPSIDVSIEGSSKQRNAVRSAEIEARYLGYARLQVGLLLQAGEIYREVSDAYKAVKAINAQTSDLDKLRIEQRFKQAVKELRRALAYTADVDFEPMLKGLSEKEFEQVVVGLLVGEGEDKGLLATIIVKRGKESLA